MKPSKKYSGIILSIILFAGFAGFNQNMYTVFPANKNHEKRVIVNPYEKVNWTTYKHHKAALHLHTLQSDGYNQVEEVVNALKNSGFTILAITDHDWNKPNFRVGPGKLPVENASPYPKDPKPDNYPGNTTWPWTDYGCPSPEKLGILGIQGNELTFRHHMNSYFSDYGVWYERTGYEAPYGGITDIEGNEIWEDDQLIDIREKKGLAIINHPGVSDEYKWWERKPLDWYVERFRNHPPDYLVGMEVANTQGDSESYDESLWDQLLARFMPARPIWGFGNNDMHNLEDVQDSYTVFIVKKLTTRSIRNAMEQGQFYFCKSTRRLNLLKDTMSIVPVINRIEVNENEVTITIEASNYDKIIWISSPPGLETLEDYKTSNLPWPRGMVVHEGETLNVGNTAHIKNFVRAELIRIEDGVIYRTFTNPFGIGISD